MNFAAVLALVLTGLLPIAPVMAQGASADHDALENARTRLSRDPADVAALRDGVQAAMRVGLIDLAAAYARRAQQLAPTDAVVMAARGAIEVHRGRPREGLALFAEADRGGAASSTFADDRALGYDLIGDQPSAQYYYAIANRAAPDEETLRRYALSLAISGDFATGDAMLRPLRNTSDRAAWRVHAFMLAIDGRPGEAKEVLRRILPPDLASALGPYMDALPGLSRAQQAAAANLGIFPIIEGVATNSSGASGMDRSVRRRPGSGPDAAPDDDPDEHDE